jgi:preprotein translocase SecE subunit
MVQFNYLRETRREMANVTWPGVRKTAVFTAIVVVFTLVMSYLLGYVDFALLKGLGLLKHLVTN